MRRVLAAFFVAVVLVGSTTALTAAAQDSGRGHKHPKHSKHGTPVNPNANGSGTGESEPSDLPMKWLFVSLGISFLIGAAGAEILVSLSPRRRTEDQTPGRPAPT
jgi:hypothetical protein